jgi:hypothetical protein
MKLEIKFPVSKGVFCFLSNLRNYLQYYGLNISENFLSVAIGYMGFYFNKNTLASREVVHGRDYSFNILFERFRECIDTPVQEYRDYCDERTICFLKGLLNEKIVPLLWINDFYLKHTEYYKRCEYKSIVPVIAIEGQKVMYYDNAIREMAISEFLNAVAFAGVCEAYYIKGRSVNWKADKAVIVQNGLGTIAQGLTNAYRHWEFYTGIEGMKQFMLAVEGCNDKDTIFNYYYQLNRPGGLAVTRENMGIFFTQWCDENEQQALQECRNIYERLSTQWRVISNNLFRLSRFYNVELHVRIIERIQDVIDMEIIGANCIEELVPKVYAVHE